MTITPHLVRSQSLPRRDNTDFYSGTEKDYSTRASYDYLEQNAVRPNSRHDTCLRPTTRSRWTKPAAKARPGRRVQTTRLSRGDARVQRAAVNNLRRSCEVAQNARVKREFSHGDGGCPRHSLASRHHGRTLCDEELQAGQGDPASRNAAEPSEPRSTSFTPIWRACPPTRKAGQRAVRTDILSRSRFSSTASRRNPRMASRNVNAICVLFR